MSAIIERIVVTGNFLEKEAKDRRTLWLWQLARAAGRAFFPGLPIDLVMSHSGEITRRFHAFGGRQGILPGWEYEPLVLGQLALLRQHFGNALVIGWELPGVILAGLNKLGTKWLEFAPHPARFLKYDPLGVRTNIPGTGEIFEEYRLDNPTILMGAGEFLGNLALDGCLEAQNRENSALFICISDAEMEKSTLKMENFEARIKEILRLHDALLVLPASDEGKDRAHLYLTQHFPSVRLAREQFYELIANPKIRAIYSLSRSLAAEARYLGVRSVCLTGGESAFESPVLTDRDYFPIRNCLGDAKVWRRIFSAAGLDSNEQRQVPFAMDESRAQQETKVIFCD